MFGWRADRPGVSLGPERFLREIKLAAQLQHPHILPLHDSGETEGLLYYVMPYVEGESLRARLARQGELPVHDAVKILIEVTDGLAHAHGRGVVHRDVKPDNVLLSGHHALVMDFGVAKAVSEATGRQQLTTAGVALGTPAYVAPEQATADPAIDHRADIYAVGVLGYELLAGHPPFTGRTAQEISGRRRSWAHRDGLHEPSRARAGARGARHWRPARGMLRAHAPRALVGLRLRADPRATSCGSSGRSGVARATMRPRRS